MIVIFVSSLVNISWCNFRLIAWRFFLLIFSLLWREGEGKENISIIVNNNRGSGGNFISSVTTKDDKWGNLIIPWIVKIFLEKLHDFPSDVSLLSYRQLNDRSILSFFQKKKKMKNEKKIFIPFEFHFISIRDTRFTYHA